MTHVVEDLPGLGKTQRTVLRCLLRNGSYPGGWVHETPKRTLEVLATLMTRGYVQQDTTSSGSVRYTVTEELYRAYLKECAERAAEHEKRKAEVEERRKRSCEGWRRIRLNLEKLREQASELVDDDVRNFVLDHGVATERALAKAIGELHKLIAKAPR